MKINILLLFFLVTFFPIRIWAQQDSLYLKNGKITIGEFSISNDKLEVSLGRNSNKKILAKEVSLLISKNKHYISVPISINNSEVFFLAEKIFDGEIDILQLDRRVDFQHTTNSETVRNFFLFKGNKSTLVPSTNLNAFYSVYFGDCYDPKKK